MKKTMLTYKILDKLESLIDINVFSVSGIEKIENLAYASAMTAGCTDTNESEWDIFCGHIFRVFSINLKAIEIEKENHNLENEAYDAIITDSEKVTVHNVNESETVTVTVFSFENHTFELREIDRGFYTEDTCKFIA